MRSRAWQALLLCLGCLAALLTGGCAQTGNAELPRLRVLFIGNSFTFYNEGIDQILRGLAPGTEVERATQAGYTLRQHLADGATMAKLQQGGWTHVVLQEQSQYPVVAPGSFRASAKRLAQHARERHATPLLLMTWARPDSPLVSTKALRSAFSEVSRRLQVEVIPAGEAFGESALAEPDLRLSEQDGHPTREGTYLAGCVVYAKLFGESPVGNSFTAGLSPDLALRLQERAARALNG